MRTYESILHEDTYEPKGPRYAFSHLQTVSGMAPVDTYIATITQADFACPECEADTSTLAYYYPAEIHVVQRLWCVCGRGRSVKYEGDTRQLELWRITRHDEIKAALAAERRLCGHDLCVIMMHTGEMVKSR